jgi:hypothetical protein
MGGTEDLTPQPPSLSGKGVPYCSALTEIVGDAMHEEKVLVPTADSLALVVTMLRQTFAGAAIVVVAVQVGAARIVGGLCGGNRH